MEIHRVRDAELRVPSYVKAVLFRDNLNRTLIYLLHSNSTIQHILLHQEQGGVSTFYRLIQQRLKLLIWLHAIIFDLGI